MAGPQGYPLAYSKTAVFQNFDWFNTQDASPNNLVGAIADLVIPGYGRVQLRYVYFNPTTTSVAVVTGAPVYFQDRTQNLVSNHVADAQTYAAASDMAIDSFAGVFLNNAVIVGQYTWILKSGYWTAFPSPASGAAKDRWVLSNAAATPPADSAYTRVALGTALGTAEAAKAYVSVISVTSGVGTGVLLNTID